MSGTGLRDAMESQPSLFRDGQFLKCNAIKPFSAKHVIQHMNARGVSETGLSAADLALIFYAKGGRRRDDADMAKEALTDATRRAFQSKNNPIKAINILKRIPGVGTSIASAIMSWVFPQHYAVWDRHSASAAAYFGLVDDKYKSHASAVPYARFNEAIYRFCADVDVIGDLKLTPQKVDVWLYNYSKRHGLSEQ